MPDKIEIVELFLENNNMINEKNINSDTPLFLAARNGNVNIIEILLAAGAKASIKNNMDQNPLHIAAIIGHCEAAAIISDSAKDLIDIKSGDRSALYLACENQHTRIVENLLTKERNAIHCTIQRHVTIQRKTMKQ